MKKINKNMGIDRWDIMSLGFSERGPNYFVKGIAKPSKQFPWAEMLVCFSADGKDIVFNGKNGTEIEFLTLVPNIRNKSEFENKLNQLINPSH